MSFNYLLKVTFVSRNIVLVECGLRMVRHIALKMGKKCNKKWLNKSPLGFVWLEKISVNL